MIVGFGTGRCGTVSLSEYLHIWHEFKTVGQSKYASEVDIDKWRKELEARSKAFNHGVGDVSLDHINNLDYWLNQDVTRILLWREQDDFVESLSNYKTTWIWKRLFPQFDFKSKDGMRRFHDWYYDTCFKHERDFVIIHPAQLPVKKNAGKHGV